MIDLTKKVYLTTVTPTTTDQYYTNSVLSNAKCIIAVIPGNYGILYPANATSVTLHNIALGVSKSNYFDYTRDYFISFDISVPRVRYVMPFKGDLVNVQDIELYYIPN